MRDFLKAGVIAGLSFLLLTGCETTEAEVIPEVEVVELSAAAQRIKDHITYLADDRLMGREAGSPGYDIAAEYVSGEFKKLGLEAAGDNGAWYQQVQLRASKRDLDAAFMSLTLDGETKELIHLEDYLIGLPSSGAASEVTAEMVFVGYGIVAPDFGIDDYKGLEVDGKIVVRLAGSATDMPSEIAAHYNSGRTRSVLAEERGAIGVISIYDQASAKRFPWDRVKRAAGRSSMSWVRKNGATFSSAPGIKLSATMSPEGSKLLFVGAEMSYEEILELTENAEERPKGFPLKGAVTLKGAAIVEDTTSPNVLGILPGSDPELAGEYVVLSAHLDHTGETTSDDPEADTINNGALDNASGIATMLEAARMLSAGNGKAPRRSVIFAAVTAEEKGLLGSEYFAHYPTVPAGAIVADINLDMPVITYPFIDVIAFGADRSSLGGIVREAAASMDVALIPDPIPQMSIFTRSDHYRFVQQGVPSVFLFLGFGNGGEAAFNDFMAKRYHRPGDDLSQELDFEQGARFAKLNALVAEAVANADERPTWNEGDFFGELYGK